MIAHSISLQPDFSRIIAIWQTLKGQARMDQFKRKFHLSDFKLVVVDEAHHSVSNSCVLLHHNSETDFSHLQILSEFNHEVQVRRSTTRYRA
jgi:type I site-specific restriction endonuclease